jgi:hypothetical protein
VLLLVLLYAPFQYSYSQCYTIDSIPFAPDSMDAPVTLPVTGDDRFSDTVNIGFEFCYMGIRYTQCVIGTNGDISFNISRADGYNSWAIASTFPNPMPSDKRNSILFPWQDLYIPGGGTSRYQTIGNAPNRIFITKFDHIHLYNCTQSYFTGQVELYETSNIIETYILHKETCNSGNWNARRAVHALTDTSGTIVDIVPGRDASVLWAVDSDGVRFTPVCQCAPLSVSDGSAYLIKVYPNPTSSYVILETPAHYPVERITIIGIDGREIKTIINNHSSIVNIDVRDLSAGVYFFNCILDKGREMVKVVKY